MVKPIRLPSSFFKARLSRRIVLWVFLSIVAIEAIILVPSVYRRERELLSYLQSLSTAQATGLLETKALEDLTDEALLAYLAKVKTNPSVLGGTLYAASGTLIGSFGEPPELSFQDTQRRNQDQHYDRWQNRYDAAWDMPPFEGRYVFVIRHDASWVRREFFAFIGRITGLVIIISIFVTGATMLVLERLLIKPILQLRQDLLTAGTAIRDDSDLSTLTFQSRPGRCNDEMGEVIAAFGQMFGQITEAINTRKASEVRFRTLVEQAADAFFVVNRQAQIIDVNQQACDSLGYSREELLSLAVEDIQQTFSQEDYHRIWHSLEPGIPQTREGMHRRRDGSLFPVEVRIGLLDRDNEPLILALARDITERKQAEQAVTRLAEIGELAAMIVHEVRNPLTTVLMGLMSFQSMDLPQRAQQRLELALEESERLQRLLNEILLYARQPTLNHQVLDLKDLVATVIDAIRGLPFAVDRDIRLVYSSAPLWVRADADKLKQVLHNLISNACEAVDPGSLITCHLESTFSRQALMSVHNGGEPIAPEVLPKLTQPFVTTKSGGNGLGLAVTRRIVEAHQGSLIITSSADAGTRVEVRLPLTEPQSTDS